mgnify:CR=1 FL=1
MRRLLVPLLALSILAVSAYAQATPASFCRPGDYVFHEDATFNGISNDECVGESASFPDRNNSWNGNGGWDTLVSEGGNDSLSGGSGNDVLRGGVGDDDLWGDGGNDAVHTGCGADYARGGAGTDTVYHEHCGGGDDIQQFEFHVDV